MTSDLTLMKKVYHTYKGRQEIFKDKRKKKILKMLKSQRVSTYKQELGSVSDLFAKINGNQFRNVYVQEGKEMRTNYFLMLSKDSLDMTKNTFLYIQD